MSREERAAIAPGAILGRLPTLYVALRVWPVPPHSWLNARPGENSLLVAAHQGGEELWRGNTMVAFERALALGADVIDSDMHLTADGEAALMHDETVDRTTDGHGAFREMMLAVLRVLDAGYYFSRAQRRGVAVIPWTIDEPDDLRRIAGTGVDGINTNRRDRPLELLRDGQ